MDKELESRVKKILADNFAEMVAIRRDFHRHPELSEHEERTARKIDEYLTAWRIDHENGIGGHGVVARIDGKKVRPEGMKYQAVAIRADIDALPIQEAVESSFKSQNDGVMHACGHDLHTAVLLGVAKTLKSIEEEFSGTVKLFFQPAEETVGGAARMIEAGCMKEPEVGAVLAFHVAPYLPVGVIEFCRGKMNAATCDIEIEVEGVSCHGAHPEGGVDAILAGAQLVTALQSIISRNLSPTNPGIVTIGRFNGGTKENVVAGSVAMHGTLRALDPATMETLKTRTRKIAEGVCEAYGARARVKMDDGYPALINDGRLCEEMIALAEEELGRDKIAFMEEPSLGADDFAFFTQTCDGLYMNVGTVSGREKQPQNIHSEYFQPDEDCMKNASLMEALGVLRLLEIPALEARRKETR